MDFFDILLASKLNRSGGAVNSVNGQTGAVELTAEDVGALSYETLKPAVDTALAQAKESGEFDGAAGKSAYAYAQDGGYTGTEAEFAAKLAEDVSETWNLIDHFTVEKAALSYEVPLQEGAKEYAIYWEYENETLPQRSIMVSSDLADFGVMYRNVYNDRAFIRIFRAPNSIAVLGINTRYAASRTSTGGTYIGSGTDFPAMTLKTNIACTTSEIWVYWR